MNNDKVCADIIGVSGNNGLATKGKLFQLAIQQIPEFELTAVSTTRIESTEKKVSGIQFTHAFAD